MRELLRFLAVPIVVIAAMTNVGAQDVERFQLSGFASVVGGKVLSGSKEQTAGFTNCGSPCFVADWTNAGVYDRQLTLNPESRIGLQGIYLFDERLSATVLVTSRATDASPRLEWAYLSYKFGDWDLQVGRKRIPLYFYSDFQDVGIAYPWVTPPPDLYGWEVTNYNGASLRYRTRINDLAVSASLFAGKEHQSDTLLYRLYGSERVATQWNNLRGVNLEIGKDWWTLRLAHARTNNRDQYLTSGNIGKEDSTTTGIAFNADLGDWVWLFEAGENARKSPDQSYPNRKILSAMGTVAYRVGPWTPFVVVSRFHEHATSAGYDPSRWQTYGLGVRYDISALQALKVQWNQTHDTQDQFTGNSSVVRVSYDVQF